MTGLSKIESLRDDWLRSGINPGDTLLLHSSIKHTLIRYAAIGEQVSPEDILNSFLLALGNQGTLLLPLFNFDFTTGSTFDIRNTPSQMGKLTEVGRMLPDAVRTGHPIYSFCAIGHKSELFRNVNNFSGYGPDSPFGILTKVDGKIGSLNVPDNQCMTYYHHVEELSQANYRYHKTFTANYIDIDGCQNTRTYGLFVRDIASGVVTDVTEMENEMWRRKLCQGFRYDEGTGLKVVKARDMFDVTTEIIRGGKARGKLYRVEA